MCARKEIVVRIEAAATSVGSTTTTTSSSSSSSRVRGILTRKQLPTPKFSFSTTCGVPIPANNCEKLPTSPIASNNSEDLFVSSPEPEIHDGALMSEKDFRAGLLLSGCSELQKSFDPVDLETRFKTSTPELSAAAAAVTAQRRINMSEITRARAELAEAHCKKVKRADIAGINVDRGVVAAARSVVKSESPNAVEIDNHVVEAERAETRVMAAREKAVKAAEIAKPATDEAKAMVARVLAARIEAEKAEKVRLEAEKARLGAEKAQKASVEAKKVEKARFEAEKAEKARVEAENAEKARIEAERAEKARIEAEKAEKVRIKAEKAEKARVEAEKARLEAEKAKKARLETEKAEKVRIEAEKAEKARLEAEKVEKAKIEVEKAKVEGERAEKVRLEAERTEKARLEAEKVEKARIEVERTEKARIEVEKARVEAEKAQKVRLEAGKAEKVRIEAEKAEKARLEAAKARLEAERAEKARFEAKKAERTRIDAQKIAEAKSRAKAIKAAKEEVRACRAKAIESATKKAAEQAGPCTSNSLVPIQRQLQFPTPKRSTDDCGITAEQVPILVNECKTVLRRLVLPIDSESSVISQINNIQTIFNQHYRVERWYNIKVDPQAQTGLQVDQIHLQVCEYLTALFPLSMSVELEYGVGPSIPKFLEHLDTLRVTLLPRWGTEHQFWQTPFRNQGETSSDFVKRVIDCMDMSRSSKGKSMTTEPCDSTHFYRSAVEDLAKALWIGHCRVFRVNVYPAFVKLVNQSNLQYGDVIKFFTCESLFDNCLKATSQDKDNISFPRPACSEPGSGSNKRDGCNSGNGNGTGSSSNSSSGLTSTLDHQLFGSSGGASPVRSCTSEQQLVIATDPTCEIMHGDVRRPLSPCTASEHHQPQLRICDSPRRYARAEAISATLPKSTERETTLTRWMGPSLTEVTPDQISAKRFKL